MTDENKYISIKVIALFTKLFPKIIPNVHFNINLLLTMQPVHEM